MQVIHPLSPREALASGGSRSGGAVEGFTELIHGSDLRASRGPTGGTYVVTVEVQIGFRLVPSPANFGCCGSAFGNDGNHFINGKEGTVENSRDVLISTDVAGIILVKSDRESGLGAVNDMGAMLIAGRRGSGTHKNFVAVVPVDRGADAALVGGDEKVVARTDSSGRIYIFSLVAVVLRLFVLVIVIDGAVLALVIIVDHVLVIGGIIIGTTIHKIGHSCHRIIVLIWFRRILQGIMGRDESGVTSKHDKRGKGRKLEAKKAVHCCTGTMYLGRKRILTNTPQNL